MGLRFVGKRGSVVVRKVLSDGEGERVGVRDGDVVVSVNGETLKTAKETMEKMKSRRPLKVTFRREFSDNDKSQILQHWKVVWRGDLNLRQFPSSRSKIVGIARFGEIFLSARRDNDWICVANKNKLGESWILSKSNDEIYMCMTTASSEDQVSLTEKEVSPEQQSIRETEKQEEQNQPQQQQRTRIAAITTASPTSLEEFGYGGYETTSMYREYSYQVQKLQEKEQRRKESSERKAIERLKRKRESEKKEKERVQKILQLNAQERSTVLSIFHDRKISKDTSSRNEKKRQKISATQKNSTGIHSTTSTKKIYSGTEDDNCLHSVRSNPWIQQERNSSKLKF